MSGLDKLIYSPEKASGEAISKVESHTPKIEAPDRVRAGEWFKVRVSVGPHPSSVEHSIRWVEIYFEEEGRGFNPVMVSRHMFTPGYSEAFVEIRMKIEKPGVIHVLSYCNLHGLWENSKKIMVE